MSNRICGRCKSTNVVELGSYGDTTYYRCENCQDWGEKDNFPYMTIFHRLTASPEVLAEKLVFIIRCEADPSLAGWTSHVVQSVFETREEAIAATVAKLKEVCDE